MTSALTDHLRLLGYESDAVYQTAVAATGETAGFQGNILILAANA